MQRSWLRDLLLLTALCWGVYCVGLTTHGLTNWQESQRALVAREMQARGEWIVPTVDGRPYLAKPPLIYWCQLAIAGLRGARTGEFELRLTVALAGWIGVLASYVVARRMLGAATAWWAGLLLATGLLYVRSSRIGELDILLAPFTVIAVGAIHAAWRCALARGKTDLAAVGIATAAACGAMMAKGPPGILTIGMAGYGGVLLWGAWGGKDSATSAEAAPHPIQESVSGAGAGGSGAWNWIVFLSSAVAVTAAAWWYSREEIHKAAEWAGVALLGVMGGAVIAVAARLATPARFAAVFRVFSRTHPFAVLGVPFAALWMWGRMVAARVGPEVLATAVRNETTDNLRLLVPDSPVSNLEAMSYGVGFGSLAALCGIGMLLRRRSRLSPEVAILIAWIVGGLIAFSFLGKGVARYLTPLWPGVAMLGGWAVAEMMAKFEPMVKRPRLLAGWAYFFILGLGATQTWWYGWQRELKYPDRCPRAFLREVLAAPDVRADRLAMFEFETPAVDFYAGASVPAIGDVSPGLGRSEAELIALRERLAKDDAAFTLLVRKTAAPGYDPRPVEERLREAGFEVERVDTTRGFVIDNYRTAVEAVRVQAKQEGAKVQSRDATK